MTLQTLSGLELPHRQTAINGAPSYVNTVLVIDAADEKAAFIVHAPKTGNIRKIVWRTGTVATGATLDVRLETVNATTGDPSGTLKGTTTNGSQVVVATTDNDKMFATQLTADAAVTRGDLLAVVIANPPTSFGNVQVSVYADDVYLFPYCDLFTASWAKLGGRGPVVGFEYDDGSYAYMPGCFPTSAITSTLFGPSSTPDVYALAFSLPFPARLIGAWIWADLDADATVKLYGADGVAVLASETLDANMRDSTTSAIRLVSFATAVALTPNTVYRLGIEPSDNMNVYDFTVLSAAAMGMFAGGTSFYLSTAKDPDNIADWTDVPTRRLMAGIIFDAFDDGGPTNEAIATAVWDYANRTLT